LHFGKPMVVLALFWDQYDNAQRMHELGLGVRLDTYRFTDAEMHGALDRLLGDTRLRARLQAAARVIQQRDGLRKAAGLIERAAPTRGRALPHTAQNRSPGGPACSMQTPPGVTARTSDIGVRPIGSAPSSATLELTTEGCNGAPVTGSVATPSPGGGGSSRTR